MPRRQPMARLSAAHVMPAPGTQILLPLVCGLVPAGPGRDSGADLFRARARRGARRHTPSPRCHDLGAIGDADLVTVTNPNNPNGRLFANDDLLAVAKALQLRAAACLWSTRHSWMSGRRARASPREIGRGNIVVLRSFGKFFGLAGLRLGFALAAPPLAARLTALLGPWAVSGPALAVGTKALADRDGSKKRGAALPRPRRGWMRS